MGERPIKVNHRDKSLADSSVVLTQAKRTRAAKNLEKINLSSIKYNYKLCREENNMGVQNSIRQHTSFDGGISAGAAETIDYITDLLNELRTIANLRGLDILSNDIDVVVKKHMIETA